ncbi:hypothetical protein [Zhaonella formicivorans]|uniref:hypothetical protein n=1 Tax=Zhaonella formicivorans TaxID=2528593 RepID=UPI0010DA7C7D|nr:hypothetical protein [Zhaonella formicivorans]
MRIKGIARYIVDSMVKRTSELSQGRNVGCFGFVDEQGYISACSEMVDGGLSGIPLRILLSKLVDIKHNSLLECLEQLPANTVFISTRPGKTGLITEVSGVDFFNMPIVNIGVKNQGLAGVGIIFPEAGYFNLATHAEELNLATLTTRTMEEEKEILRQNNELGLRYLEVGRSLEVVDLPEAPPVNGNLAKKDWTLPRLKVQSLSKELADALVAESMEIGQGREVAMLGLLTEDGTVLPHGKIVHGGIGYVPARLLASSGVDISGKSLKTIYSEFVPENAVIVHTHPGGTGVMHIGDAHAGPGTWGRPIIAIGHDKDGSIQGATVIEVTDQLFELADEDEILNLQFFTAKTPEEEAQIRNRKFGIAQDYTGLCKTIEIR